MSEAKECGKRDALSEPQSFRGARLTDVFLQVGQESKGKPLLERCREEEI